VKKILLSGKYSHLFALVDDEDYEYINQWKWYYTQGYARRSVSTEPKYMHKEIMKDISTVDHINGNKLDNRKDNLRPVTRSQNSYNRKPNKGYKYKGVWFRKSARKYIACISFDKKKHHLGYFETEKEAAVAYNEAAIRLHGEYARLNIVEED
jgi:hypothetical protein